MLDPAALDEALHALGAILEDRGHAIEIVSVGGASPGELIKTLRFFGVDDVDEQL